MNTLTWRNKQYYQDETDNHCQTCVFAEMPVNFCMLKQLKCLSVSNRGGLGNWKELNNDKTNGKEKT